MLYHPSKVEVKLSSVCEEIENFVTSVGSMKMSKILWRNKHFWVRKMTMAAYCPLRTFGTR